MPIWRVFRRINHHLVWAQAKLQNKKKMLFLPACLPCCWRALDIHTDARLCASAKHVCRQPGRRSTNYACDKSFHILLKKKKKQKLNPRSGKYIARDTRTSNGKKKKHGPNDLLRWKCVLREKEAVRWPSVTE